LKTPRKWSSKVHRRRTPSVRGACPQLGLIKKDEEFFDFGLPGWRAELKWLNQLLGSTAGKSSNGSFCGGWFEGAMASMR